MTFSELESDRSKIIKAVLLSSTLQGEQATLAAIEATARVCAQAHLSVDILTSESFEGLTSEDFTE